MDFTRNLRTLYEQGQQHGRRVLGWLLICPNDWDSRLRAELFVDRQQALAFMAMENLYIRGAPRFPDAVAIELASSENATDCDWKLYLDGLVESAALPGHERWSIATLEDCRHRLTKIVDHRKAMCRWADLTTDVTAD